jgi:hypothetical protein
MGTRGVVFTTRNPYSASRNWSIFARQIVWLSVPEAHEISLPPVSAASFASREPDVASHAIVVPPKVAIIWDSFLKAGPNIGNGETQMGFVKDALDANSSSSPPVPKGGALARLGSAVFGAPSSALETTAVVEIADRAMEAIMTKCVTDSTTNITAKTALTVTDAPSCTTVPFLLGKCPFAVTPSINAMQASIVETLAAKPNLMLAFTLNQGPGAVQALTSASSIADVGRLTKASCPEGVVAAKAPSAATSSGAANEGALETPIVTSLEAMEAPSDLMCDPSSGTRKILARAPVAVKAQLARVMRAQDDLNTAGRFVVENNTLTPLLQGIMILCLSILVFFTIALMLVPKRRR